VIGATRIARRRVALPRATTQAAPRGEAIVAALKAASIIATTNARIAPA
jgi:hypothetical protein